MIGLFPVPSPALFVMHPPKGKLKPLSAAAKTALKKAIKTRTPEDILAAKKALSAEGRYSCCITGGGCLECLLEGACACGPQLNNKEGVCKECVIGWKVGMGKFEGILADEVKLEAMSRGSLGNWPMMREGSGTSWLPDSSPMFAVMGQREDGTTTMLQGQGFTAQTRNQRYTTGSGMAMAWGDRGDTRLAGRLMLSADPLLLGRGGYPLLFQTGEGVVNRQHPHDFVKELAVSAARRGAFVYAAPIGEPALGPPAYVHRPSALDNPEAPLTHHFFDSTHITHGVITMGVSSSKMRLEGSYFNGREPDNNRWKPDPIALNSGSVRFSINPDENHAYQVSYGVLTGGERRTSFSVSRSRGSWQSTLVVGQKRHDGKTRSAALFESAKITEQGTLFGRGEWLENDELPGNGTGNPLGKLTVGAVRNLSSTTGVGASLSVHHTPTALRAAYGSAPWSASLFVRIRTPRM